MANFSVTVASGNGAGTLAAAIGQAEATPEADTISFATGSNYILTDAVLQITTEITIDGDYNNDGVLDFSIQPAVRHDHPVFWFGPTAHVTLDGLNIANGADSSSNGVTPLAGGITNYGQLAIVNSSFSLNRATGGAGADGGVGANGTAGNAAAGAIYNAGSLSIVNTVFYDNESTGGDGGDGGVGTSGSTTVVAGGPGGNGGNAGHAATIINAAGGTMQLSGAAFYGNDATGGHGGIGGDGGSASFFGGNGGRGGAAAYASTVFLNFGAASGSFTVSSAGTFALTPFGGAGGEGGTGSMRPGADGADGAFGRLTPNMATAGLTIGTDAPETITGLAGDDAILGLGGNDRISGGFGRDEIIGDSGNDILEGGAGDDYLNGADGDDLLIASAVDTMLDGYLGIDTVDFSRLAGPVSIDLSKTTAQPTPFGSITMKDIEDVIGTAGNDTFIGTALANRLDGGAGADTLSGAGGNDFYIVDSGGDNVIEQDGGGVDTAVSRLGSYTLTAFVEDLYLDSLANVRNGSGNDLGNTIVGNDEANILAGFNGVDVLQSFEGNDTLDGGGGNDFLDGGNGDDIYRVDGLDAIFETVGGGTHDKIESFYVSFNLSSVANVEDLTLTGSANINAIGTNGNNRLTGNAGNNILNGGGGNDVLNGGLGADTLNGGNGDDVYLNPTSGTDTITEAAGAAGGLHDRIQTTTSFNLSSVANVEDVTLTGNAKVNAIGNGGDNVLVGNAVANTLNGGGGADTLTGGAGNDTMNGGAGADLFKLAVANTGADTINGFETALDKFNLSGGTFSARVEGGGNTTLTHAGGTILVTGVVGLSLVQWNALVSGTARAAPPQPHPEQDFPGGPGDDPITGTVFADNIWGEGGNDTLSGLTSNDVIRGGTGSDAIDGGEGNDTLYGGTDLAAGEIDRIHGGSGDDTIYAEGGYTEMFGEGDADTITGAAGQQYLNGGAGNDILTGGAGDDIYDWVDGTDTIVELDGGGIDRIYAPGSYSLAASAAFVERLGTAGDGTGNDLDNVIYGGAADQTLSGGKGNDSIYASYYLWQGIAPIPPDTDDLGNDTFHGGDGNDLLVGGNGNDTFFGEDGGDTMKGGAGANTFDGGAGDDHYEGGADGDTYYYAAGDTIVDAGGGDLIYSYEDVPLTAPFIAGAVEDVTLLGSANAFVTGTAVRNVIAGNDGENQIDGAAGNDELSGGLGNDVLVGAGDNDQLRGDAGADALYGGAGDDTYVLDDTLDTVIELDGDGQDTINARFSMTLPDWVENLSLVPADPNTDMTGTGNALANLIQGYVANDTLSGLGGADTLQGGTGDDTYVNPAGDTIIEAAGPGGGTHDAVQSDASYNLASAPNVEDIALTGTARINAIGNNVNNRLTGNAGANILNGGGGNDVLAGLGGIDTMNGGAGNDIYVNPESIDIIGEAAGTPGGEHDRIQTLSSFNLSTVANVEDITLVGGANVNAVGNNFANILIGNAGNNTINGGGGADTLAGGAGNDTMNGGSGADLFKVAATNTGADRIDGFETALDHFDLSGGTFSARTENGANTTLTHTGGAILVTGVTGLDLAAWNALVVGGARTGSLSPPAFTGEGDRAAVEGAWRAPFLHHDALYLPAHVGTFGSPDFLYA